MRGSRLRSSIAGFAIAASASKTAKRLSSKSRHWTQSDCSGWTLRGDAEPALGSNSMVRSMLFCSLRCAPSPLPCPRCRPRRSAVQVHLGGRNCPEERCSEITVDALAGTQFATSAAASVSSNVDRQQRSQGWTTSFGAGAAGMSCRPHWPLLQVDRNGSDRFGDGCGPHADRNSSVANVHDVPTAVANAVGNRWSKTRKSCPVMLPAANR